MVNNAIVVYTREHRGSQTNPYRCHSFTIVELCAMMKADNADEATVKKHKRNNDALSKRFEAIKLMIPHRRNEMPLTVPTWIFVIQLVIKSNPIINKPQRRCNAPSNMANVLNGDGSIGLEG
ncbi:unnamed protein product [Soboliphyme baturini]|uniref:MADF domain-containing protein n=1 Tax=Soboliphyme baturini TaxID=241478 RepID=A0A183IGT2_9BILA|nr:unnamed protein product [Soboliphyme baturini]